MNPSVHSLTHFQVAMKKGLEIKAGRSSELLDERTRELLIELHRRFDGRRRELLAARAKKTSYDFLGATESVRTGDWKIAADPRGAARPAGGDHRAGRTEDDHQRAQLGRQRLHGRLRGLATRPPGRTCSQGQEALKRRGAPHDHLHQRGGQGLPAERQDGGADGRARAAGTSTRSTSWSTASRSRARCSTSACTSSTTRPSCSSAARGRTSTCRSWRATSRRGCGTTCSASRRTSPAWRSGTIKATVLIETILAAFEMDEILYELREHSAGLNCGRWDYIFSFIKKFSADSLLPDRGAADDGPRLPARLLAAADPDLPPPRRPRDGRHGGADSDQGRPGRQRGRARQGARRQAARGGRRPRRHLGGAPGPGAGGDGDLRRSTCRGRTSSTSCATT